MARDHHQRARRRSCRGPDDGRIRLTPEFMHSLTQDQVSALLYHRLFMTKRLVDRCKWVEVQIEELDFNTSPELAKWFDEWNWLRHHEQEVVDWNAEEGWVDIEYRVILANNLSTDRDTRSYQYWIPGENHLPHNIKNWRPYHSEHIRSDGVPQEAIDKYFEEAGPKFKYHGIKPDLSLGEKEFWLDVFYACEDYERMEDYGKTWSSVGVVVELVIDGEAIDTTSCWGIESDSDNSYFDEMAETLVHDIAIRTHERIAHTRKVSSHLSRIGRNYKAWEKRRKEKDGAK